MGCGTSSGPCSPVLDTERGGNYAITGTVSLPADASKNRSIGVTASRTGPDSAYSEIIYGDAKTCGTTFTYTVKGLADGFYTICVFVDQNGDVVLNSGDYEGCFSGTLESPIKDSVDATEIQINGVDKSGIDFGVGVRI